MKFLEMSVTLTIFVKSKPVGEGENSVEHHVDDNFINVTHANFSYKLCLSSFFSSYMYVVKAAKTTFVRKICTFNVDEIDTW